MDFQVNLNLLGWFLACVLLESFIKFPVDPYYEPLSWFMMMDDTFLAWRQLKILCSFPNDNSIAKYLLKHEKEVETLY